MLEHINMCGTYLNHSQLTFEVGPRIERPLKALTFSEYLTYAITTALDRSACLQVAISSRMHIHRHLYQLTTLKVRIAALLQIRAMEVQQDSMTQLTNKV